MTKKTAASAATVKPCLSALDGDTASIVKTHRGHVVISSGDARLTRDAAQAVNAFFENEKSGHRDSLTIHPSWATTVLLDDDGFSTALVVAGPDIHLIGRAGAILDKAFDIEQMSDSDEPEDPADDADADIEEDCEAVSPPSRKQPHADDKDKELDELVDAYNQLGATCSSYARALRSGDMEVADRLALTLTELEVRIERLEMPTFVSPETRAERIFAARDSKHAGRRR